MSNGSMFFVGVGTTILFLGAGFGGGLMLAKTAMEPVPQNRVTAADRLPPARIILPPSAEPAPAAAPTPAQAAVPPAPAPPRQQAQPQVISAKDVEIQSRSAEKERADSAERRTAEAAERERRRRYAERKAMREAAHAKQRQEQQGQEARRQEQPGIVAFGADNEQPRSGDFFGN